MAKRRARRRIVKTLPRVVAPGVEPGWPAERVVIRQASNVERLAYTRRQAAEALGLSRSTFIRRVLPYVDTVEMPWGAKLIPVDELERLLAEQRRAAKPRPAPPARGRPPLLPAEVIERIQPARRAEPAPDRSRAQRRGIPTAHGGKQWWPSTVRTVLTRAARRRTDLSTPFSGESARCSSW